MLDAPDTQKVSREQAESAADALIVAARDKQQQAAERNTLYLVHMFPGLAQVPPAERQAVLSEARTRVNVSAAPRALLAVIMLVLAAAVALAVNGHWSLATGAFVVAIAIGISRQFVERMLVRRHLQRLGNPP